MDLFVNILIVEVLRFEYFKIRNAFLYVVLRNRNSK